MFLDLDGNCVDAVKKVSLKGVFSQVTGFVGGKEDASDIFSKAAYSLGRSMKEPSVDAIRRLAEGTDSLEGFLITHSTNGGTGSGFNSLLLEELKTLFPKKVKFNVAVTPSGTGREGVLSDHNSTLAIHSLLEHSDLTVMLQNESIYNILKYQLDIEEPSLKSVNRLIARHLADITSGARRLEGPATQTLQEMLSNLVPYPTIKLLTASLSPWLPKELEHQANPSVAELMANIFEPLNCLSSVPILKSKLISCDMVFRGDISPSEVTQGFNYYRSSHSRMSLTSCCLTSYKAHINSGSRAKKPHADLAAPKFTIAALTNSAAVTKLINEVAQRCDKIYARRAFHHFYIGEGMESGTFSEARENLAVIARDYKELTQVPQEPQPNEEEM